MGQGWNLQVGKIIPAGYSPYTKTAQNVYAQYPRNAKENRTFLKENRFPLLSSYDFTGFVGVYSTEFQCLILEPVNFFLVLNYLVFNEHGNA